MNVEIIIKNLQDLASLGKAIADDLTPNTILLLDGELGAGKTALMKEVGKGLGVLETITSPTFTLINEYYSGRLPLYHIDLYRLDQPHHIANLHLENYWQGEDFPQGVIAIEWANKLPHLPEQYIAIGIEITAQDWRKMVISATQGQLVNWHNVKAWLSSDR